uniref:Uncharacterized protein n=2 Tax=Opuntia streptacantha TaxID=393608 RepID=A0A7C9EF87_OPUST
MLKNILNLKVMMICPDTAGQAPDVCLKKMRFQIHGIMIWILIQMRTFPFIPSGNLAMLLILVTGVEVHAVCPGGQVLTQMKTINLFLAEMTMILKTFSHLDRVGGILRIQDRGVSGEAVIMIQAKIESKTGPEVVMTLWRGVILAKIVNKTGPEVVMTSIL